MKFDVSSLAAGTVINNAVLSLYVDSAYVDLSARKITVHRLTSSWVENEATWIRRDNAEAWNAQGGDIDFAVNTITAGDCIAGTWVTFNISWLVQGWVASPASNHGILIRSEEKALAATYTNDIMFTSSEDAAAANRPLLEVTYGGPLDDDADGLPDAWEIQYFGTAAAWGPDDDPDGDGADNAAELAAGTSPVSAASVPGGTGSDDTSDSGCLPGGGYAGLWPAIAAAGWLAMRRRFRPVVCQCR